MFFWPIKLAFKLVSLLIGAIVVYLVTSGVQVVLASRLPSASSALGQADAIVVLGTTAVGAAPSPDLLGRLQQALAGYQGHVAGRIVVTGPAATATSGNVAEVAKAWLSANGVPADAIAPITAGNAATAIAGAASELGSGQRVVIVTDALNALWAGGLATKDGLVPAITPATGSERPFYREIGPIWTQASAIAIGRIVGYGRTTWAGG